MTIISKSRVGKWFVGTCLSLAFVFSAVNVPSAHAAPTNTAITNKVISTGKHYQGVPYKFGAKAGNTRAFDCSSFTQYVFKKNGIRIPRSSKEQSKAGTFVPKSQLKAGDLVFSDTNRDGIINHVSLYMGNNKLIHTYSPRIGVTLSTFKGSTWDKTYVTARRVLS